jgi:hypothetical protein
MKLGDKIFSGSQPWLIVQEGFINLATMKASEIVEFLTVMYQLEGDRTLKGMSVCAELERIREEAVMAFTMCCPEFAWNG